MAQSPEDMARTMIANMPAKTGKSLDEWVAIIKASGLEKHGEMVKLLKSEHGMTHGFANLVGHAARGGVTLDTAPSPDLVEAQYAGPKAGLRPIHDALIAAVSGFGNDVELAPKKAYVSLRRTKQFGLVQPSTKTRLDLGLNLKGVAPNGRLEASGSFNAMCTHRVRLESVSAVDAEVIGWLREAYDAA
jgi:predicted transport protein